MILMTLIIMAMVNLFSKPNISVFVLLPLLFPSRVSRMWEVLNVKLTKLTSQTKLPTI